MGNFENNNTIHQTNNVTVENDRESNESIEPRANEHAHAQSPDEQVNFS